MTTACWQFSSTFPKATLFTALVLGATVASSIVSPRASAFQESTTKAGEASATATAFLRLAGPADDPTALEAAIVRYVDPARDGVTVDLVSAVHIGEAAYYETLNELFKSCDVVLYELVAEPGTRVPEGGARKTGNPVSFLQSTAQGFLGLESQLEKIDYQAGNFRHADLSPAQLAEKMRSRGDTGWSIALDTLTTLMEQAERQNGSGSVDSEAAPADMFALMSDPLKAKRFLAAQFADPANLEAGLGGKLSQLIVSDRNEAAAAVLDQELEKGSQRIAIFYGAAHMPDMEKRLAARGFRRTGQSWLAAWDLTTSSATPANQGVRRLLELMNGDGN